MSKIDEDCNTCDEQRWHVVIENNNLNLSKLEDVMHTIGLSSSKFHAKMILEVQAKTKQFVLYTGEKHHAKEFITPLLKNGYSVIIEKENKLQK